MMETSSAEQTSVLCTLLDKNDQSQYVIFTQKRSGKDVNIGFTNGENVWRTEFSEEILSELTNNGLLNSTEDYTLKLKRACRTGKAFVMLKDDDAVLHPGAEASDINLSFSKLPDAEGKTEVKDLIFKMAESLIQLESRGAAFTPVKYVQKKHTVFEPKKLQKVQMLAVKKRQPGDSLINPGTKRKKPATGVAFEDDGE